MSASSERGSPTASPSPFDPPIPRAPRERHLWGNLPGASLALALANAAHKTDSLMVVVTQVREINRLQEELRFFLQGTGLPVFRFPDWETLPYDLFSPLPELISERLRILHELPTCPRGLLLVPVTTLLQRLAPRSYVEAHAQVIRRGDPLPPDALRQRLEAAGYRAVSQVLAHGEYALRDRLVDVFPMGRPAPYRIAFAAEGVADLRAFDPETQRSREPVTAIQLLPAREFPLDAEAIATFRQAYRATFEGDPKHSLIYRDLSEGKPPGGLEYYLPLFFQSTASLFAYLPDSAHLAVSDEADAAASAFLAEVNHRYERRRQDRERPPLPPERLYLRLDEWRHHLKAWSGVQYRIPGVPERTKGFTRAFDFAAHSLPSLDIQARAAQPARALQAFLQAQNRRVLFVAESAGRRAVLSETLRTFGVQAAPVAGWREFLEGQMPLALATAPLEQGLLLETDALALITETQLYGERVRQERRRVGKSRDSEVIVRDLTELHLGAPVVHEDHGIGRYRGLQVLQVDGQEAEFLRLEYARGDTLYVPVSALHRVSRYTGASPEQAPLHRLGGDQWERIKAKAARRAQDVAAELLDIHARRAARQGIAFPPPGRDYEAFAEAFAFEETPDQARAIQAIIEDMTAPRPMDRLVCGDVGFGKTEVAMRTAFLAVAGGYQVAVLTPTTLLAQQHVQNFRDRFADWPVRIEGLSRFRTAKEQRAILQDLAEGKIQILIGTHRLLQKSVRFARLGLIIIDEEHRFGVRHKEALKALRSEVDILTLTATPIPRTLNMALSGLRDLSIIATPPVARHPIKTFVTPWSDALIQEAISRELGRGGQVYFLHNEVETIENLAQTLGTLIPEARIRVAHGQMRERELERVMRDFYHQRFHLLVCTTIIESGIDVPSANTILINRADRLGLAQLHQLRGRVGRSHHRAYAYLITPPTKTLKPDAKKRLAAIASLEELGAGFTLATHDLEIRGAGELLGEEQSGQIQEVGFNLYRELLDRAVRTLKSGHLPQPDEPLDRGPEIDLGIAALLPSNYVPDVHTRLVLYKRIASAPDLAALRELQVELVDRFGLLPEAAEQLFALTELRLRVQAQGIEKIQGGPAGGWIQFDDRPDIDPRRLIALIQSRPQEFRLEGGNRLRFFGGMADPAERIPRVRQVLKRLIG